MSKVNLEKIDFSKLSPEWNKIRELVSLEKPSTLREAVIRSDKLLDSVLRAKVAGETMSERLKSAGSLFNNQKAYQDLWDAHKIRNLLVHDMEFELPHFAAKEAIEKFKRGIEELGVKLT